MKDNKIKFNIKEVDTAGLALFNSNSANGNPENCKEIAAIIMQYSSSLENKQYVKEKMAMMAAQRYGLFGYDVADFDAAAANLLNIYSGGNAQKKIDISREVPFFSDMASQFVDEGVTLLKYDRLFTLYQCTLNSFKVPGDIVELGVFKGGSCKFMCELFAKFKPDSKKEIFAFDTFEGHAHVSSHDGNRHKIGHFKTEGTESVSKYVGDTRASFIQGDASITFPKWSEIGRNIRVIIYLVGQKIRV